MEKLIHKLKKIDALYLICYSVILLPNARPIFKYFPIFDPIIIFLFYILIIYAIIHFLKKNPSSKKLKDYFSRPLIILIIIIFIITLVSYLYPLADGLKDSLRGSDQDDCVILGATLLSKFQHPYSEFTYFGNPCSQGLGMLILYIPFVMSGFYPLGAITSTLLSIWSIKNFTQEKYRTFIFSAIIISSVFWFELLSVGSDLIFLGSGMLIISHTLIKVIRSRNDFGLLLLAVFSGLIASTRINFLILSPLLSLFIFKHWKKGACIFLIISASISIIPSILLYFSDPQQFMPLHLLGKSDFLLKNGLKQIAIILSLVGTFEGYKLSKRKIENIPIGLFLSLFPSLFFLSLGDFIFINSGNPSTWEGANYLMPIFPLAASIIAKTSYLKDEK